VAGFSVMFCVWFLLLFSAKFPTPAPKQSACRWVWGGGLHILGLSRLFYLGSEYLRENMFVFF